MSTKNTLITSNNNKIRNNVGLIDRDTDHATFNAELIDNLYPNVISVNHTDTSIITLNPALAASITYNVDIWKQGRTVTMRFHMIKSTTALFGGVLFTITNSEYLGKPVTPITGGSGYCGFAKFDNPEFYGELKSDNTFVAGTLDGGIKRFEITYQTLN
jgi:hypothetical protein